MHQVITCRSVLAEHIVILIPVRTAVAISAETQVFLELFLSSSRDSRENFRKAIASIGGASYPTVQVDIIHFTSSANRQDVVSLSSFLKQIRHVANLHNAEDMHH